MLPVFHAWVCLVSNCFIAISSAVCAFALLAATQTITATMQEKSILKFFIKNFFKIIALQAFLNV
jgi:hypothetical protein